MTRFGIALMCFGPALATEPARASAPSQSGSPGVVIRPAGSRPSTSGAAQHFTGSVRIDPLFDAADPSRASGADVTFEPGARSAWLPIPWARR